MQTISKSLFLAARPKTLFASLGPVLVGIGISYNQNEVLPVLICIVVALCALLLQTSSNYINDYYDGIKGTDTQDRLGPKRMTSLGLLTPNTVKKAFLTTLSLSFILGLYLMKIGGLPIIIIGFSSLFFAWAYTGGPFPLSYFALGEVFAYIFFGPVAVWGSMHLSGGTNNKLALLLGSSIGLLSSAIMAINNLRDRTTDIKAKKTTLATLLPEKGARLMPITFVILSYLLVTYTFMSLNYTWQSIFFTGLLLRHFKSLSRVTTGLINQELNDELARMGKFLFINSIIMTFILVWPWSL